MLKIATLLDPRFKVAGFTSTLNPNESIDHLYQLLDDDNFIENIEPPSNLNNDVQHLNKKYKGDFLDNVLSKHLNRCSITLSRACFFQEEVQSYLKIPNEPIREDVIKWWELRKTVFPNLFRIASKYLCIPATSATSGRIFSKAGLF